MLLLRSMNTQSFDHYKSSSVSHFINGKPYILQNLLIFLSRVINSRFKGGTAGRFASPSFSDHPSDFATFSVLYLMIYHQKQYH